MKKSRSPTKTVGFLKENRLGALTVLTPCPQIFSRRPPSRSRTPLQVMLLETKDEGNVLPKSLSRGIAYAAAVSDMSFLLDRNVLQVDEEEKAHIRPKDVEVLFNARCEDLKSFCGPSTNEKMKLMRYDRFHEVLCASCKGMFFSLRQAGLGPRAAAALEIMLRTNTTYTVIDLTGNPIGDAGALHLASLLKENSTVVVLLLVSVDLGPEGVTAIANALQQNKTLTHLDMGGMSGTYRNHFGAKGCEAMAAVIANNKVLSTLRLASCGLDRHGVTLMIHELEKNYILTDVSLASNTLSVRACEALATTLALGACPLTSLSLSRTKLGISGMSALGPSLGQHHVLTTLDLSRCSLPSAALGVIAQVLQRSSCLETLDLEENPVCTGDCPLTDERILTEKGIIDLCVALSRPTSVLKCLILSKCSLIPLCGHPLGELLARNRSLTKLDIANNYLGDEGVITFATGLEQNETLKTFYMDHNKVSVSAWGAIFASLRFNRMLVHLRIAQGGDPIAVPQVLEVFEMNHTLLSIDFSTHSLVTERLLRNKNERERNAPLRLDMKITELKKDENELLTTLDDIVEEGRRKDRLTQNVREMKERVKFLVASNKEAIKKLEDQVSEHREVNTTLGTVLDDKCYAWDMKRKMMEDKVESLKRLIEAEHVKREASRQQKPSSPRRSPRAREKSSYYSIPETVLEMEREISVVQEECENVKRLVEDMQHEIEQVRQRLDRVEA